MMAAKGTPGVIAYLRVPTIATLQPPLALVWLPGCLAQPYAIAAAVLAVFNYRMRARTLEFLNMYYISVHFPHSRPDCTVVELVRN